MHLHPLRHPFHETGQHGSSLFLQRTGIIILFIEMDREIRGTHALPVGHINDMHLCIKKLCHVHAVIESPV